MAGFTTLRRSTLALVVIFLSVFVAPTSPVSADTPTGCQSNVTVSRDLYQPILYAKRAQYWFVRRSVTNGGADLCFIFGDAGDIGVMGDWNGDAVKTPGVFRPSIGTWYLSNSPFAASVDGVFKYGSPGDVPVVGDWDSSGSETIGVFRRGAWYLTNHSGSGTAEGVFRFGQAGDEPISGSTVPYLDLYRPSTATLFQGYVQASGTVLEGSRSVFGNPGDHFVSRLATCARGLQPNGVAVFRPSTATWWFSHTFNRSSTICEVQFGEAADQMLLSPPRCFMIDSTLSPGNSCAP